MQAPLAMAMAVARWVSWFWSSQNLINFDWRKSIDTTLKQRAAQMKTWEAALRAAFAIISKQTELKRSGRVELFCTNGFISLEIAPSGRHKSDIWTLKRHDMQRNLGYIFIRSPRYFAFDCDTFKSHFRNTCPHSLTIRNNVIHNFATILSWSYYKGIASSSSSSNKISTTLQILTEKK